MKKKMKERMKKKIEERFILNLEKDIQRFEKLKSDLRERKEKINSEIFSIKIRLKFLKEEKSKLNLSKIIL